MVEIVSNDKTKVKHGGGGKESVEVVDFDSFLSAAGEFGKYQWMLFFSSFPFYIFGAFTYFGQMFMTETSPNHWCWVPELANLTDIERRAIAIPIDADAQYGYSQCQMYVANWSEIINTRERPNYTTPIVSCQNGWEFNKTEIPYPTIASELGWVCDKRSYQATAQSLFFVGSIIGGFIIGWVADRFGRLPAATCANMVACIAGIASIYTTNFTEFAVCRFFVGMGYDNCMIMTYLLALEYVAPRYRTLIANLPFAIFYTMGITSLPWIALACGHWKAIGLATSVPLAVSLLAPFVLPESPRWLLSKGRVNDTISKVLMVGRINKKEIPVKMIEQFKSSATRQINNDNSNALLEMLKRPMLRKMFLIICIEYMCLLIVFDVSARTVGYLQFDFFLSFTLVSLTEFPSLVLISFILDLTGRRWLTIVTMFACSIFCFLTAFVTNGLAAVMCAVIARFTINMAVNTAMQWGAEMLPTPVRGSGSAIIHICGNVATVISPFIAYLSVIRTWLPMTITGIVSVIAVFLAFHLPETAKTDLPHTFENTEEMIRKQSFWDLPCARKLKGEKEKSKEYVNSSFEMHE